MGRNLVLPLVKSGQLYTYAKKSRGKFRLPYYSPSTKTYLNYCLAIASKSKKVVGKFGVVQKLVSARFPDLERGETQINSRRTELGDNEVSTDTNFVAGLLRCAPTLART